MTRHTKCHPCLPAALIAQFQADPLINSLDSAVYKPEFEELRHKFVSGNVSSSTQLITPDQPTDNLAAKCVLTSEYKLSPWLIFDTDRNRTWLHVAAHRGDIPLVYEMIRLGTAIDTQDSDGLTALQQSVENLNDIIKTQVHQIPSAPIAIQSRKTIDGYEKIATLLIEQHADVNIGRRNTIATPLSVAVQACRWPLVELLLRHGASQPPLRQLRFKSTSDKAHYKALAAKYKTGAARPPRPCPCWSGKLLSDCHAAEPHPYPADFICKCGSGKVYAKCCVKREFRIEERWNESSKCIAARCVGRILLPKVDVDNPGEQAEHMQVYDKSMAMMGKLCKDPAIYSRLSAKMYERRSAWIMEGFGARPDVDPAYLYTCLKATFFPRPWAKHLSKVECKQYSQTWNKFVDEYISTVQDPRSKFEIELAAKIGLHGGPLYRHCEAKDCYRVEGREVERMKCCAGCKLIFYCSASCQSGDWQRHRAVCKSREHKEQQLPSQDIFEEVIMASAARARTENIDVATLLRMFSA